MGGWGNVLLVFGDFVVGVWKGIWIFVKFIVFCINGVWELVK